MSGKKIHNYINQLETQFIDLNNRISRSSSLEDLFDNLTIQSTNTRSSISSIGGSIYNSIIYDRDFETLSWYYEWLPLAKYFYLEYRNSVLNLQKSYVKLISNEVSQDQIDTYVGKQKLYLKKITTDFVQVSNELTQIEVSQNDFEDLLQLENPWNVYKEQLEKIEEQILSIAVNHEALIDLNEGYHNLKNSIKSQLQKNKELIKTNIDVITNLRDEILYNKEDQNIPQIIRFIEEKEGREQVVDMGTDQNEIIKSQAASLEICIANSDAQVIFKNINARLQLQNWKDSEVSPLTYELIETTENNVFQFNMTLLNLKNQLMVMNHNEDVKLTNGRLKVVLNTLKKFIEKSSKELAQIENYQNDIANAISRDLNLSNIYNKDLLLFRSDVVKEIPSSDNPLNDALIYGKTLYQKYIKPAGEEFFNSKYEPNLLTRISQINVDLMKVVAQRNEELNNSYSNIFLTKSYTGESFWIARHQMLEVDKSIEFWKKGFGGSILLTGNRQCGKTVFLHMIGRKHFANKFLKVSPNSVLELEGRTINISNNIEEVLDFIEKNALSAKYLISIDNLELWCSVDNSLSHNIEALLNWIGKLSKKHFFAVTLGHFTLERFDDHLQISDGFQQVIDISQMRKEEMYQAITIRHGATHSNLYDENLVEINEYAFKQKISTLFGFVKGSIGDALQFWSIQNKPNLENKIINKKMGLLNLPFFINGSNMLILKTLLTYKKVGEYRLRKLFGPAFGHKYSHQIEKLLNLGVIRRLSDGKIEVSIYCANDVARMIKELD